MILDFEILDLETRHPFRIARPGAQAKRRTVWIRLTDADGVEGWGEAAANNYYGETVDTVAAVLPRLAEALEEAGTGDPFALERIELALDQAISRNPAARAAVSMALHRALACVVRSKHEGQVTAEAPLQPGKVSGACAQVLQRIEQVIGAEAFARGGNDLHQAERSCVGPCLGVVCGLHRHDGMQQPCVHAVLGGHLVNERAPARCGLWTRRLAWRTWNGRWYVGPMRIKRLCPHEGGIGYL